MDGGTGNVKTIALIQTTDGDFALAGFTENVMNEHYSSWLLRISINGLILTTTTTTATTPGLGALSLLSAVIVLTIWYKRFHFRNLER